MPLTSGDYAAALKINYLPPLNDQIYRKTVMLNRVEKNSEDVSGLFAYIPLITGKNPGVGSRGGINKGAEAGSGAGPKLPAAGRQTYSKLTFNMNFHYGRGSVTGPAKRSSKSDSTSFARALDAEMKGLSASLPDELNKMVWNYGHGRRASLVSGAQATGTTKYNVDSTAMFHLRVGDRACIADITTGAIITAAVGGSTVKTITLDSAANQHKVEFDDILATGATQPTGGVHAIYQGSDNGNTIAAADISRANEMYGIPALVDDGAVGADEQGGAAETVEFVSGATTIGGLDRTSSALLQSSQLKNPDSAGTNRPLTYGLMEQAWMRSIAIEGASEGTLEIYTNPSLWATFGMLTIGDRIYNDFKKTMEGGFLALFFNNTPIFYDKDAPRDIFWFLDMSTLMLLTQTGYEFLDDDGSQLRQVAGFDVWEFSLVRDVQMGIRNFRKNTILNDIEASQTIEGTT